MHAIAPNAFVTLDYTLRDEEGDLIDASTEEGGEPMRYVHGYASIIPALEFAVQGLRVGEEKSVVVEPQDGFGSYDDELVMEIGKDEVPQGDDVQVGDEFTAVGPNGEEAALHVVEVFEDSVLVDGNHPLAGVTLHYHVKVRDIRPATPEEIEGAAAEWDAALDEANEGSSAAATGLVTLRRKDQPS